MCRQVQQQHPIIYLITSGATNAQTTPASEEFGDLLKLVAAAISAHVSLIQLREKNLTARVLYELTTRAAELTRGTDTRLLVNDRADIARTAGADGVHLRTSSLNAKIIRTCFGSDFMIGVSTHSAEEARAARDASADFVVWGPVFPTESTKTYKEAQGLTKLATVVSELAPFPVIALGGIGLDNVAECVAAGARGIAGIGIFKDRDLLTETAERIREIFKNNEWSPRI